MFGQQGSRGREFEPEIAPNIHTPETRLQSEAEHVHRAAFLRADTIRDETPGVYVTQEFHDREPRAILRVHRGEQVIREEFVESSYSANLPGVDDEYLESAKRYGQVFIHFPEMSFREDYVIRRLTDLWAKLRGRGAPDNMVLSGYLYDYNGLERRVI